MINKSCLENYNKYANILSIETGIPVNKLSSFSKYIVSAISQNVINCEKNPISKIIVHTLFSLLDPVEKDIDRFAFLQNKYGLKDTLFEWSFFKDSSCKEYITSNFEYNDILKIYLFKNRRKYDILQKEDDRVSLENKIIFEKSYYKIIDMAKKANYRPVDELNISIITNIDLINIYAYDLFVSCHNFF